MTQADALRIAQDVLDRSGADVLAGDLDATIGWCAVPCIIETLENRVVAHSRAELQAICEGFIETLRSKHVTHMVRRCLDARFDGEADLSAVYETRYVDAGNALTEDPYTVFVRMTRNEADGNWKIRRFQFAVTGDSPPGTTLRQWMARNP